MISRTPEGQAVAMEDTDRTILLVDDEEDLLYSLKYLLDLEVYTVITTTSPEEGLQILRTRPVSLIISDQRMPEMVGTDFLEKASRIQPHAVRIILTAYADLPAALAAINQGRVYRFVSRPVENLDLKMTIEQAMSVYNLRQENRKLLANYRAIFDAANDAIFVHDTETAKIIDVNRKGCEMYGYTPDEVRYLNMEALSAGRPPYTQEDALRWMQKALQGEPQLFEWMAKDRSGRLFWVEVNLKRVLIGNKDALLAIVRDITERKQVKKEQERMQAQLVQAQKMEAIGALAGGIAHDFNNLLTAIQGYTDLAMMSVEDGTALYGKLEQVHRASARAASLTRQLLFLGRKQPMKLTLLDINQTTTDLLKVLRRLIGEDIAINTKLEADPWKVRADAGYMEQVIMNLAVHAKEGMPEGGTLTIQTENVTLDEGYCRAVPEGRPGRFVCLEVADSGMGLDKTALDRIFEPFFTTRGLGVGTGLGLSMAHGIIKQHQGWINVYSEPGRGATFKVYLPAAFQEAERQPQESLSGGAMSARAESG